MESSEIKIIANEWGYILCKDRCPYSKECAIHETAGQFRSEDGFSPRLYFSLSNISYCFTINEEPLDSDYGSFPQSIGSLGKGPLRLVDGRIRTDSS